MEERATYGRIKMFWGFAIKTHVKVLKKNGVLNGKVRASINKSIKAFPTSKQGWLL
jgi:hypothetical protein